MRLVSGALLPLALLMGSAAYAQTTPQGVFYGGLGAASDEAYEDDTMPWSLGVMFRPATSPLVFGFDIAGEGTKLDGTYGYDSLEQAFSFNFTFGGQIVSTDTMRLDAALLIGARETAADCSDSYLGYRCYADAAPEVEYEANYGAIVSATFGRGMLGVRATSESVQALVGIAF